MRSMWDHETSSRLDGMRFHLQEEFERDEAETEPELLSSEDWLAAVTLIAEVGEFLEKESS